MCATLSINDGLVDVEQAQAGIQAQCEDKRFLSSVLTPSVRVDFMRNSSGRARQPRWLRRFAARIAESVAREIHGRLRGEGV